MESNLICKISQADSGEISALLDAVVARHNELFPDWELLTISLHKEKDRNDQLNQIIKMFERLKDK